MLVYFAVLASSSAKSRQSVNTCERVLAYLATSHYIMHTIVVVHGIVAIVKYSKLFEVDYGIHAGKICVFI